MQATHKLSKSQDELKTLRKEKQEAEQREKETTMKRLFEMKSVHDNAVSCQEASERDLKALKNILLLTGQWGLLEEEIRTEKQKSAKLQQEIAKATNQYSQIELCLSLNSPIANLYHAAAIKKEREQLEADAKAVEDRIMLRAENEKKKYWIDIKKLESRLSLLKYNANSAKIAALR
ncbi:hypothetical protein Q3G72_034406 [Acer saccharum]|nr:hypothetical protein Q3G72_034406 [Acer saccharum]